MYLEDLVSTFVICNCRVTWRNPAWDFSVGNQQIDGLLLEAVMERYHILLYSCVALSCCAVM